MKNNQINYGSSSSYFLLPFKAYSAFVDKNKMFYAFDSDDDNNKNDGEKYPIGPEEVPEKNPEEGPHGNPGHAPEESPAGSPPEIIPEKPTEAPANN